MKNVKKEVKETKPLTKEQAEALAKKMTEEGAGKCVIGVATKGETKLTLKDLVKDTKEQKFRTFCITRDKAKESGLVLAKINGFRVDKANNVYMIADIVLSLRDVEHVFTSGVWAMYLSCGVMWEPYGKNVRKQPEHLNIENAYKVLGYKRTGEDAVKRLQIWEDMLAGKFQFSTLSDALNVPTECEVYAKNLYRMWKSGDLDSLTYLRDRMDREEMSEKALAVFCEKEHEAYVKLGMTGAASIAEEANMVMAFYKEKNAREKEERRAARKANK